MSLNTCTASTPVFKAVAIIVVARKTSITTAHSGKLLGGVSSGGWSTKSFTTLQKLNYRAHRWIQH